MRIPLATYRLQFTPSFRFQEGYEIIPYLVELGISDIYASPIFKARLGSNHGYDIVNPWQINPQLGGNEDFRRLTGRVKEYNMGWLQDIVPNHMAFDGQNPMLMDIFEHGLHSQYFKYFDIEWEHYDEGFRQRLLAPFLGKLYKDALEGGEINVDYQNQTFSVNYFSLRFPLKLETYVDILTYNIEELAQKMGADPHLEEFDTLIRMIRELYAPTGTRSRYELAAQIKEKLFGLYNNSLPIREFIHRNLQVINGQPGVPDSFNLLDQLLSKQLFRLSFWKIAAEELNYRRFFNINELISVRVEDDDVFQRTHQLILEFVSKGIFTGLRVDHLDGLYNPDKYIAQLKSKTNGTYTVVEKILEGRERLPGHWPVQGTSGYDFVNAVNGLYCQKANERHLTRIYNEFIGERLHIDRLIYEKKRAIVGRHMAGDIDNLAHLLRRIAGRIRYGHDFTLYGLKRALVEVMVFFPIYRTYVSPESFTDTDRQFIRGTLELARSHFPSLKYELDFIELTLLLRWPDHLPEEERLLWYHFVMRFQQFTGPLMAKGYEDTALYVYNRLISLNEVGSSLYDFGYTINEFHEFNEHNARAHPNTLLGTSTHDTKRSEDVRARINVLSEMPQEWEGAVKEWSHLNAEKKKPVKDLLAPSPNDEYFLYQTLIGSYPDGEFDRGIYIQRIKDYVIKAVREAKVYTAWIKPDEDYEQAALAFVESILDPGTNGEFLNSFESFHKKISVYGKWNSLSQLLVKMTAVGVPDFYQGTELWDYSLVDPDNRRPVDYQMRYSMLKDIQAQSFKGEEALVSDLLANKDDGRIKLYVIWKTLLLRKQYEDLFAHGQYIRLEVKGALAEHVIAYARVHEAQAIIAVAPRFFADVVPPHELPVGPVWKDTAIMLPQALQSMSWKEQFNGQILSARETLRINQILQSFVIGLLHNG